MIAGATNDDRRIYSRAPAILVIRVAAATLSAMAIVAFQSEFLPFFQPLFVSDRVFWPAVYYGYWILTVCVTIAVLVADPAVRRQSFPILIVCLLTAALTFLHPFDWVAKNLVVAMMLLICITVLILGSTPSLLLKLSATVTALTAVICCLDILFADGLTNTAGRAAGLAINPNDAATGLFLAAAATYRAVPKRLQNPFLLLVGGAIFFTLSRSTLLAAVILVSGVGALSVWQTIRNGGRPRFGRAFSGLSIFFAVGLLIWCVAALFNNDRFAVAATDSFDGIRTAIEALERAGRSVRTAVQAPSGPQSQTQSGRSEAEIVAIGKASEQERNSVSARGLFMWRAFITYASGPFFGSGLAVAHEIAPHNTFLMFAVAFGHPGWLVPFALIGLTFYRVRDINQLPLGLATTAVMMISHDILFPSLIVPIAVGIAGNISKHSTAKVCRYSFAAIRCVVLSASIFFIVGCGAVIAKFGDYTTFRPSDRTKAIEQIESVFAAPIPRLEFAGVFRLADLASQDSVGRNLFLLEDGKVLSDVEAPSNPDHLTLERGQYLVWRRRALLFSTSDGSDPRSNGRIYEARMPVSIHPLILLAIGAILIWCAAIVRGRGELNRMKE
jgi:O-Antigen ligase